MADTTAFITLENISKQFPGVLALDNVNLTLKKAKFTVWRAKTAVARAPSLK